MAAPREGGNLESINGDLYGRLQHILAVLPGGAAEMEMADVFTGDRIHEVTNVSGEGSKHKVGDQVKSGRDSLVLTSLPLSKKVERPGHRRKKCSLPTIKEDTASSPLQTQRPSRYRPRAYEPTPVGRPKLSMLDIYNLSEEEELEEKESVPPPGQALAGSSSVETLDRSANKEGKQRAGSPRNSRVQRSLVSFYDLCEVVDRKTGVEKGALKKWLRPSVAEGKWLRAGRAKILELKKLDSADSDEEEDNGLDVLVEDPKAKNEETKKEWSEEEMKVFEGELKKHGKDFLTISKALDQKSVKDIVQYYYLSKNKIKFLKLKARKKANRRSI